MSRRLSAPLRYKSRFVLSSEMQFDLAPAEESGQHMIPSCVYTVKTFFHQTFFHLCNSALSLMSIGPYYHVKAF